MPTPNTESQNYDPQELYVVQDQQIYYDDNNAGQELPMEDMDSLDWLNRADLVI
jgi:hypothetical protein